MLLSISEINLFFSFNLFIVYALAYNNNNNNNRDNNNHNIIIAPK